MDHQTHNTWYTEQYNTRHDLRPGLVDDVLQRAWPERAAAARASLSCVLDLPYGEEARQVVDLFPAAASRQWVVFIHGGYWKAMTGKASSFIAPPLVQAGYSVAIPTYRLCPDVTIGTIIEDCVRAIAWLVHRAAAHSAGCEEIIVAGHSAGGHLAASMFCVDWRVHDVAPAIFRGAIGLSGLYDLDPIRQCEMNAVLGLMPQDVQAWSPARLRPRVDAPLVLAAGAQESSEFHRQMQLLAGAPGWGSLVRATVALPARHHFDLLEDFLEVEGALWRALRL